MENNANQLNSLLCKRNCGFYGNAAYDGYCSKCYKDHVKRQNSGSAAGRVTPTTQSSTTTSTAELHPLAMETPLAETVAQPSTATQPIAIPSRVTETVSESSMGATSCEPNEVSASCMEPVTMPPPAVPSASPPLSTSLMSTDESMMSTSLPATSGDGATPPANEKKKRTRCCVESCKRKVGLTGFDCRCGGLYCWEHRYSDKHDCKFDYKELGQDQIRKNNPIVVGEKIQKI